MAETTHENTIALLRDALWLACGYLSEELDCEWCRFADECIEDQSADPSLDCKTFLARVHVAEAETYAEGEVPQW